MACWHNIALIAKGHTPGDKPSGPAFKPSAILNTPKLPEIDVSATAVIGLLRLLHAADSFPKGGLYQGYYAVSAALRYESHWCYGTLMQLQLPAQSAPGPSRHPRRPPPAAGTGPQLVHLLPPGVVPPLDVALAWLAHRLDPPAYASCFSSGSSSGSSRGATAAAASGSCARLAGPARHHPASSQAAFGFSTTAAQDVWAGAGGRPPQRTCCLDVCFRRDGLRSSQPPLWPPPPPGHRHDPTRRLLLLGPRDAEPRGPAATALAGGVVRAGQEAAAEGELALRLAALLPRLSWQLRSWLRPAYLDTAFLARAGHRYARFLALHAAVSEAAACAGDGGGGGEGGGGGGDDGEGKGGGSTKGGCGGGGHANAGAHQQTPKPPPPPQPWRPLLVPAADIALIWAAHMGLSGRYEATCRDLFGVGGGHQQQQAAGAGNRNGGGGADQETAAAGAGGDSAGPLQQDVLLRPDWLWWGIQPVGDTLPAGAQMGAGGPGGHVDDHAARGQRGGVAAGGDGRGSGGSSSDWPGCLEAAYRHTAHLYEQVYGEPYDDPDTAWLAPGGAAAFPLAAAATSHTSITGSSGSASSIDHPLDLLLALGAVALPCPRGGGSGGGCSSSTGHAAGNIGKPQQQQGKAGADAEVAEQRARSWQRVQRAAAALGLKLLDDEVAVAAEATTTGATMAADVGTRGSAAAAAAPGSAPLPLLGGCGGRAGAYTLFAAWLAAARAQDFYDGVQGKARAATAAVAPATATPATAAPATTAAPDTAAPDTAEGTQQLAGRQEVDSKVAAVVIRCAADALQGLRDWRYGPWSDSHPYLQGVALGTAGWRWSARGFNGAEGGEAGHAAATMGGGGGGGGGGALADSVFGFCRGAPATAAEVPRCLVGRHEQLLEGLPELLLAPARVTAGRVATHGGPPGSSPPVGAGAQQPLVGVGTKETEQSSERCEAAAGRRSCVEGGGSEAADGAGGDEGRTLGLEGGQGCGGGGGTDRASGAAVLWRLLHEPPADLVTAVRASAAQAPGQAPRHVLEDVFMSP